MVNTLLVNEKKLLIFDENNQEMISIGKVVSQLVKDKNHKPLKKSIRIRFQNSKTIPTIINSAKF